MGKASKTKVESSRREKLAAQRAAERRAERRRRILIASGSIIVVVAVVLTFVIIKLNNKPSASAGSSSNGPTGAALTAVVNQVTSVPTSVSDAVGDGGGAISGYSKPTPIKGTTTTLTANGKPEMLYMGAEYCPYCGAERWAMIVALSRFGTFKGLATIHSAAADGGGNAEPYPNTPTWTFLHASYSSPYLTFTPVETYTNVPDTSTGFYYPLETPTKAQEALITKYGGSQGTIPFIDFGNKSTISGASYDAGVLAGLSWSTVAADLHNPNSTVAQSVLAAANYITAAICQMTGNQPASACTSTIQSLESQI